MAVKDKARVRALLSAKWPKAARLTNARLDAYAAKLDATDDSTDEEITEELETINKYTPFEEIVVADDKVANDLTKAKKKAEEPAPKPKGKTGDAEEEDDDEEPAPTTPEGKLMLKMAKRMESLEKKLEEKDRKESQDSLRSKFEKDERLKGVPASWIRNNVPTSEDDYEQRVEDLAKEFEDFATENKLESYKNASAPESGKGRETNGKVTQVKQEEADELADDLLGGVFR